MWGSRSSSRCSTRPRPWLGITWWPAHPGTLAWVLLGLQAAACLSLVARRRAPLLVIAVLGGFTLAVTLLISPAGALTPANMGNVWAPFGTSLAAYGPFYYRQDRRVAFFAVALLTVIVARPWQPSVEVITSRTAAHRGGAAAGAVLRGPARPAAVAAGAGRPGRAGAVPARRAGPDRGTGPAGRRDARRGHAPGQPDGAAGRGAADDRPRRGDPARGRGSAGDRLPGPGRAARPGRDPAHAPRRRRDARPRTAWPRWSPSRPAWAPPPS